MNRRIDPCSLQEMKKMLSDMEVSTQGVENMAPKGFALPVRLTAVEIGAANIIKQEMLSVGADAAMSRGIVEGKRERTDMILLGTVDKIRKVIHKLDHYTTFGIPEIRDDLSRLLKNHLREYHYQLNCRGKELILDHPKVMGILNVTPDSFSDGGEYPTPEMGVKRALELLEQGAVIVDIGGESTRPGALPVDEETEINRIIPVISGIREKNHEVIISVDTYKSEVARRALAAGADLVNDISSLRFDRQMGELLSDFPDVPVILMHMKGTPRDMQQNPVYENVVDEILCFLEERINFCLQSGVKEERIIVDPGIGFGKGFAHNMEIFRRLSEFHSLGIPLMIGASRKSFINKIYPSNPEERLNGSLAISALAYQHKVSLVRVHDVKEHYQLIETLNIVSRLTE